MKKLTSIILFAVLIFLSSLAYSQKIEDQSEAEAARINIEGVEFLKSGNPEKAESCFHRAISLDAGQPKYYNNLAVSFMRMKNYQEAYQYLNKAVTLNEKYAKALSNMAITCFYLGHYMDAYKYYLRAGEADKEYTATRFERQKAMTQLEKLSNENPDNGDYRQMLDFLKESEKKGGTTAIK
jgi:tetratricopeptide (TPR) repeat protein